MFRKVGLAAILALVLAGSSFFGLHSSGSKAEAACPPGDTGCNNANNLLFIITNASNSTSVFVPGVFGPVIVPQTVLVTAPIFTVPVQTAGFNPFLGGGFCGGLGTFGFCPGSFSAQLAQAGFNPFFGPGFNPFFASGFNPFFSQFFFP